MSGVEGVVVGGCEGKVVSRSGGVSVWEGGRVGGCVEEEGVVSGDGGGVSEGVGGGAQGGGHGGLPILGHDGRGGRPGGLLCQGGSFARGLSRVL